MLNLLIPRLPATSHCTPNIYALFAGNPDINYQDIMARKTLEDKRAFVWSLPIQRFYKCRNHPSQLCDMLSPPGSLRVLGPPCQDFAASGAQLGLNGPTVPTMLTAGRKSAAANDAAVCLENSPLMPSWYVRYSFPAAISWADFKVTPANVGFNFISRLLVVMSFIWLYISGLAIIFSV